MLWVWLVFILIFVFMLVCSCGLLFLVCIVMWSGMCCMIFIQLLEEFCVGNSEKLEVEVGFIFVILFFQVMFGQVLMVIVMVWLGFIQVSLVFFGLVLIYMFCVEISEKVVWVGCKQLLIWMVLMFVVMLLKGVLMMVWLS